MYGMYTLVRKLYFYIIMYLQRSIGCSMQYQTTCFCHNFHPQVTYSVRAESLSLVMRLDPSGLCPGWIH